MLLVGLQEGHPACKKTKWWGAGVVICLQRGADLHMAQLMPLPLTVSCSSKIHIGFTFLVLAHLGSPGQRVVKRVCVCVFFQTDWRYHCLYFFPRINKLVPVFLLPDLTHQTLTVTVSSEHIRFFAFSFSSNLRAVSVPCA